MATGEKKGKTSVQGMGTVIEGEYGPECYFYPGSTTLFFLEVSDTKIIEQKHDFLSSLLGTQKQTQEDLDDTNFEAITQAGRVSAGKSESETTKVYETLNKANQALRKGLMSLAANPPEGELLNGKMKDTTTGIMELIPLRNSTVKGFKKTYVRSDKAKRQWRTYKSSEVDKEGGGASFIKYKNRTAAPQDVNDN